MSRSVCWTASVLLFCWLLAGCRANPTPDAAAPSTPTVEGAAVPDRLDGTQWTLTSLQGQPPLPDTVITLDFRNGKLGGRTGCNHYGAQYTLESSRLKTDLLTQTVMLCSEPAGVMEQEERYLKVLGDATLRSAVPYRVVAGAGGNRLEITDNLGVPLLVFVEKQRFAMDPLQLPGKAWRLVALQGEPPVISRPVMLYFLNEREYSGFAGCRHYYGSYQAEGDTIQFPSAFMLGPDCHENEALTLLEGSYTNGLSEARNYHLHGDRLDLRTDQGQLLSFLAEPQDRAKLPDGDWRLLAFFGPVVGADMPFRVPAEPLLQTGLSLSLDGEQASGSAGCNTYTTAYSIEGDTITFQTPSAARKLCAQPDGVMRQEQVFLRALDGTISYRLLGEQLWLNREDGQSLLFTRQP